MQKVGLNFLQDYFFFNVSCTCCPEDHDQWDECVSVWHLNACHCVSFLGTVFQLSTPTLKKKQKHSTSKSFENTRVGFLLPVCFSCWNVPARNLCRRGKLVCEIGSWSRAHAGQFQNKAVSENDDLWRTWNSVLFGEHNKEFTKTPYCEMGFSLAPWPHHHANMFQQNPTANNTHLSVNQHFFTLQERQTHDVED